MQALHYVKAINPDGLHAQLVAAIPALAPVPDSISPALNRAVYSLTYTTTDVWLTVPDSVATADVDAVVAAHSVSVQTAAQQQATQDTSDLAALKAQYTTDLSDIDTALGLLPGATSWTSLTAAQQTAGIKSILQRQRRTLKALVILVRRLS